MEKENNNIVKFNKGFQINIGVFIMVIIILYVCFHIFSSLTKKEINVYEVSLGTIVEKNFYQGMALRHEVVVNSDRDGYLHYYLNNRSRVGMRSRIYAVDTKGDIVGKMRAESENYREISTNELKGLSPRVDTFLGSFEEVNFSSVYTFKGDVEDYISDVLVNDLAASFSEDIARARDAGTYIEHTATYPGLLVYTVDGYEGKNVENFTDSDFNAGGYSSINLRTKESIANGEPVYKLVTDDDWQLVIPIDGEKAKEIGGLTNIEVRFTQDNAKTWAGAQIITKEDHQYLLLSFDDSMERYASQRFINVELLIDEKQGLKIPNSAICEKDFYVVPKAYFYAGGNTNEEGVMIRRGGKPDEFVMPTIYYESGDYYYIDNEIISAGDKLLMQGSTNVYTVGSDIDTLSGCYNINKGYAVFRPVVVVYKNEDYTIVRSSANYSLSLYDHIVLDATSVKENEII